MAGQNERWFKAWVIPEDHWIHSSTNYMGAWYDLIGLAEWKDGVKVIRGQMVNTERGAVYMSIASLANRWQWNWRTVKKFISMLEMDGMVQNRVQNGVHSIFLCNYAKYQGSSARGVQSDMQNTMQSTVHNTVQSTVQSDRQFLPNNEEVKEYKEDKKSVCRTFVPPTISDIVTYAHEVGLKIDADRFWNYYQSNGWMVGRNKMKDWKAAVRNWSAKENGNGTGTKPKAKSFDNFDARPDGDLFSQYINQLQGGT